MVGRRGLRAGDHLTVTRRSVAALGLAAAVAIWVLAAVWLVRTSIPSELHLPHVRAEDWFEPHELSRARSFSEFDTLLFGAGRLATLAALALFAKRGLRWAGESGAGPVGTGSMLAMLGLGLGLVAGLPFTIARLWWARRHDLAHISYVRFVIQDFLTVAGTLAAVAVAVFVAMGLAQRLGSRWPLPGAVALVAISTLLALASPWLIPSLHPLRDPVLLAEARELARREDVEHVEFKVQNVGRETTSPNAEAVGVVGGGRVILWDTLLDGRFTRREVDAVIAHELGHLAHDDGWRVVGISALFLIPAAFVVESATRRRGGMRDPRSVPVALLVVVALQLVTLPVQNAALRRLEANADWSSLRATGDPAATAAVFQRLGVLTLNDPRPPLWERLLTADHPTLLERIEMACAWAAGHPGPGSRTLAARCR